MGLKSMEMATYILAAALASAPAQSFGEALPDGFCLYAEFDGKQLSVYEVAGTGLPKPIQVLVKSHAALSGPWGNKCLPDGVYQVYEWETTTQPGMYCKPGDGWKAKLKPLASRIARFDLRIHPDGGPPGTEGCVGVECKNAATVSNVIQSCLSRQRPGNPFVLVVAIRDTGIKGKYCTANPFFSYTAKASEQAQLARSLSGKLSTGIPTDQLLKKVVDGAARYYQAIASDAAIELQNQARADLERLVAKEFKDVVTSLPDAGAQYGTVAEHLASTLSLLQDSADETLSMDLARVYSANPKLASAAVFKSSKDPAETVAFADRLKRGADLIKTLPASSLTRADKLVLESAPMIQKEVADLGNYALLQMSEQPAAALTAHGPQLRTLNALGVSVTRSATVDFSAPHKSVLRIMGIK